MSASSAELKAREILDKAEAEIPVDVASLAEFLGVAIVEEDLEDSVSGMLIVKDERGGIIGVNANHHPNRKRFTVAHELAHYVLHRKKARVFVDAAPVFFRDDVSSEGTRSQEIEANTFAAELLMPKTDLVNQLDGQPVDAFDELSVRRLAARFEVSSQALTIRLTRLGLVTEF